MDGHNHMPGMSPTETQMNNNSTGRRAMVMMGHMTFFWSKNAEILFSGWPGTRTGMYVLALLFVFVLSVLLEWLSQYCNRIQYWNEKDVHHSSTPSSSSAVMVRVTVLHGVKIGVAYLLMLAVMSFNVGVLIVAVAGHTVGFLFFGRKKTLSSADLSPGNC